MLRYSINIICFILGSILSHGQSTNDSIQQESYGLRVGIDLSRPILSALDDNYSGFEFVGDYRLTQKLYLAAEVGNEKKSQIEDLDGIDLYDYTTNGSYIKIGVDNNTYTNWKGEQNLITIGGRYAFSTFSQTLNSYRFYESNRTFNPDTFLLVDDTPQEFGNRTASWLELVIGAKAKLFNNVYGGISIRLGYLITDSADGDFPNLWIPGFNKVTDGSNFGIGYNYSISYFLPFYKKAKEIKPKLKETVN
ncbi:Hypothetical protein I595_2027 [Croceitalea dokdonensis DOKDO 023]|uniref:Outer membrane protein beta-barrel domain-containing protein n=1 Tax=Croceitalea dokdonensis DOKDO 023 TaxID=1300341 RepID=A0A0N8H3U4_9FLAO|nr:DUF6048 family protein [Croceitalea dokdonensis]KPM31540.1 Hypothetical protein I595_2027 [Croceitalea dokdonensis DOKDO 023]